MLPGEMSGERTLTERLDLRLPVELAEALRIVATRSGRHRGAVVRDALRAHLLAAALQDERPGARAEASEDPSPNRSDE